MTRRIDRCARALPILAMAAASALLSAQTVPTRPAAPAAAVDGSAPSTPAPSTGAPAAPDTSAAPSDPAAPKTGAAGTAPLPAEPNTGVVGSAPPAPNSAAPQIPAPPAAAPDGSAAPPLQAAPPDAPPPPATQPSAPGVGPAAVPAPGPTTGPTTAPAVRANHIPKAVKLEFKDAPLDRVIDFISESFGYTVKKSGPIDGRINLVSRTPVTGEVAITMLDEALADLATPLTAIPDGPDGTVLKIVKISEVKREHLPVVTGADPEAIPNSAAWVTQVIPVKNIDAVKLRTDLQPMISAEADFTSNQGSNALILTDTNANIKRVVTIVAELDKSTGAASRVKIYHLKYATGTATAKLLTTIFAGDSGQNAQGGGGGGRGGRGLAQMMMGAMGGPGGGGGGGGGGSDTGKTVGKVSATADDRTNSVIVVAPDETMKLIDSIISDLDADSAVTSAIQTFQLNYADAPSAAKLINSVFQSDQQQGNQPGNNNPFRRFQAPNAQQTTDSGGKVTAAAADKSNTLVVTAPPGTMKIIEDILKKLDEDPAAHSQVTVFQLNYADSASAAKLINSIFTGDSTGTTTPTSQQQRGPGGAGPGGRGQQPEISGATTGGSRVVVNAVSDDRTNTVVVTAPTEAMRVVSQILEKLDSNPSAESALFIYHLKNGVAADIQQTLSNLFSTGTNGSSGGNTTNRTAGNTSVGSNTGFGGTGSRGGSSGLGGSSGIGGSSGGVGGSTFGQPLTSNTPARPTGASGTTSQTGASAKATSELVGQVIVVADNDTNSLLVSTASKYREQVMRLIAELDRPVPQVLIKVLVAEVTRDRTNDFGADWNVTGTRASGKGVTASTVLNNLAAQATEGGLVVGLTEDNFSAVLHALSTDGKLDVLSRPYILASDNQLASITIGQEVPFITNTQITDTGQQINTITYQAVGIILNVTPHINPDGAVTLDVAPEISAISATTVPIGNGINAPVIDNRSAQSRVTVKNGNTVVIGGMMQDQKTVTINKIPLLGDIPYLGAAFSRTQTDRSKTELVIFLTPHVAPSPEVLPGMTDDELRHSQTLGGAVDPGVFQQHLKDLKAGSNVLIPSSQPSSNVVQIQAPPSTQPFKGINISGAPESGAPQPASVPGK